jgi:branched-chain amino acid transport system ATP-binding protein
VSCLKIDGLSVRFGGLIAVDDLALTVRERSIHSLIGPNGAGKTTVINTIAGINRAATGSVRFFGKEILGTPSHKIARSGVARTFQNTELFPEMSVLENVLVGAHQCAHYGTFSSAVRMKTFHREEQELLRRACGLLETLELTGNRHTIAANLPFGKQRLVELARALAADPKLLLLDEPAAGLRAAEINELNRRLVWVRDHYGVTILLVDHVMQVIMNISDCVTVLNFGRKISEGAVEAVRTDPEVQRAYLGRSSAHA